MRVFQLSNALTGALLAICFAGLANTAAAQDSPADAPNEVNAGLIRDGVLDLDAVVRHFENMYRSSGTISEAELTVTKPRRTRTIRMKAWTEGEDRALFVIESPVRDKGTATLKVDRNLWNYLPRIKRTIRIPPSMMQTSWMGSDFTNDDLVRESSFENDYAYELEGPSAEPAGWKIVFVAKPGVVGLWNRFELIVSEDGTLPLQAQYFDRKDRLSRTLYWEDVKLFGGRKVPTRMTLIPEDKAGHKTVMVYLSMEFDVDLPESTFSLSRLEQSR